MGSGSKLAIEGGNGDALFLPTRHQLSPNVCYARIEAENSAIHSLAETGEPRLERRLSFSRRQPLNAPAQFSDSDSTDVELRLVITKPRNNLGVWLNPSEFTEDVGIDEIAHNTIGEEESLARGDASSGDGQASI